MISPELIRRYPFFAGLTRDQINTLAKVAEEKTVAAGHIFFHEGDKLNKLFFVLDGNVDLAIRVPASNKNHDIAEQILGNFITDPITVSTVGPGQIFAWSSLIPPHNSTADARATIPGQVIVFDSEDLFEIFQRDCQFGYLILQKVASVIRKRLHDMRIQSLAFIPA
jgi:CRP-like cAMP-binding protein